MTSKGIKITEVFYKNRREKTSILFIYRYISLILTSLFYFLGQEDHGISRKIFIISCLTISTIILSYLYLNFDDSNKDIRNLLAIETSINSILIIPSGGINSPFIWYALNTILIYSVFFKYIYTWINVITYIFFISSISYLIQPKDWNVMNFITHEYNLILSFIMIVVAIQLWTMFANETSEKNKQLSQLNRELNISNKKIKNSINHINALYRSVSILENQGNKEDIIDLLFKHTIEITNTKNIFYMDIEEDKLYLNEKKNLGVSEDIQTFTNKNLKQILNYKEPQKIKVRDKSFIVITLRSNYADYGIFGIEDNSVKDNTIYLEKIYQLKFLSEIISISFENFYLNEINEKLLITEEQNRIADEIHDSVIQRLFGMSCSIYGTIKSLDNLEIESIEKELNDIRNSLKDVMKDLRSKIYSLSWEKEGNNSFVNDIKSYIEETKRFNNIDIIFSVRGRAELLSHKEKTAFYRMICESIGNSVRHGNPKLIEVDLDINRNNISLIIKDDGGGFDLEMIKSKRDRGLGIENLYKLAEFLNGDFKILSKLEEGTTIELIVPK